jgi:hypothetical protein
MGPFSNRETCVTCRLARTGRTPTPASARGCLLRHPESEKCW